MVGNGLEGPSKMDFVEAVGAQYYVGIMGECNIIMGVSLPQSEHVDIFPVRLVSTFHRVFSVYLTLAVYLTWSSLSLRAE